MRSTGIMAALVALLAAYTIYEYKNSDDSVSSAKGEKRIFYLLRDDLDEIDINVKGVETVIKRDGTKWQLTKPVADLADSSAVEGFIYTLLTQKGKEFRSDSDKQPVWAEFGLDPAASKVAIHGKGKTEMMEVSSKSAFDGSFYIRVKDQLWLGDRGLAQLLEREPNSFRSRKIYRGPEEVNSAEVHLDYANSRESYSVKRSNAEAPWTMEPAPGFPIDSTKVAGWVQKLSGISGNEFAPEMPKGKPSMEILFGGTKMIVSGDVAEDAFITTDQRPTVYKVSAGSLDQVRVPKIYFRDGKLPFKFNLEQAKEIEVHTGQVNNIFAKKDLNWGIKRPVGGAELDQEKLLDMVHNIQNLEAAEFVESGKGLPATPQVAFKSGDGKIIFSLAWGAEYKPKYGFNKGSTLRFARVSGLKEVVGLPKDKLDRLVDSAIIKKKAESK